MCGGEEVGIVFCPAFSDVGRVLIAKLLTQASEKPLEAITNDFEHTSYILSFAVERRAPAC
jgi:hypothetical protein